MATVFRNPIRRINPETGKGENAVDDNGRPLFHPKWRAVIATQTYTFGTNKPHAQKQANMIEQREREIRNGTRAVPAPEDTNASRSIGNVFQEYFTWGEARGGRRNMPWDDQYAATKKRHLAFWGVCLNLEKLGDIYGIFPKVEAECHKMLGSGNGGKTVSVP